MPADSEMVDVSPTDVSLMEVVQAKEETEKLAPRRSTRISGASKPAVEDNSAKRTGKISGASKKRSVDDAIADDKPKEDAGNDAKKVKVVKSKKPVDESTEGLSIGDSLPDLVLKNEKDEDVNVQSIAADSAGVVLFLVPKADTPGCTTQACGFRDVYPDFEALNFKVFCLSADSPSAQNKWQTKKSLPYPLLSDPKRVLIVALTGSATKTPRSHFIFAGGKLVEKKMPVKPADSPRLALESIKALDKDDDATADAVPGSADADADTSSKTAAEAETSANSD
ncbi:hypothetical protein M0805_004900 [Coniferiporia weirii]|nr:hypothetical protein M0805_004900 [Coniferiporia weirii]